MLDLIFVVIQNFGVNNWKKYPAQRFGVVKMAEDFENMWRIPYLIRDWRMESWKGPGTCFLKYESRWL